jgi:hypothetical protein
MSITFTRKSTRVKRPNVRDNSDYEEETSPNQQTKKRTTIAPAAKRRKIEPDVIFP